LHERTAAEGHGNIKEGTVKPDWPILINLRLEPLERTGINGSSNYYSWFFNEFR
jgi:hypothetical protein